MDISTDVISTLAANKEKRVAASTPPPAAPVVTEPTKEIQAPVLSVPVEVKKDEAVPVAKKPDEAPKPEKPSPESPTETPAPVEAEQEYKWDQDIPDNTTIKAPASDTVQADLKKIGSALKLEVNDEQQFVSTVSEKLTRLQELEKLSLDGIPTELKQAIEVAKKGGDWLSYTKAVGFDANTLNPEELFDREYERANIARFKKADGTIDYDAFDLELSGIAPGLKLMQGQVLKNAVVQQQQFEKARVMAQVTAQQETFQQGLAEAARDLSKLIPQDQFGVVIEPKHSSHFYQGIVDGSLVKKHIGNIDPAQLAKFDSKKLMKTLVLAELGEKISTLRFKQGETAGKKSLLKEVTNPQTQAPAYLPRPEEPNTAPEPTSAQRLKEMKERTQPKNSL